MNWFCILPKICGASFRKCGRFFDTAKKDSTMSPLEFLISKIKLGLKLLQRGHPLKELRGRHVVSIQFFVL